jgi:hypothetical protein
VSQTVAPRRVAVGAASGEASAVVVVMGFGSRVGEFG